MKRGSLRSLYNSNNVNAFLTCTTRSMPVCARLIIASLIYSLYFPPRCLESLPCLRPFRSGASIPCTMQLAERWKSARGVFRHVRDTRNERGRIRSSRGESRGRDVEIKRHGRGRLWLVAGDRESRRRFHASLSHSYLLRYKQKYAYPPPRTTIAVAECRALTSNAPKCVRREVAEAAERRMELSVVLSVMHQYIVCGFTYARFDSCILSRRRHINARNVFIGHTSNGNHEKRLCVLCDLHSYICWRSLFARPRDTKTFSRCKYNFCAKVHCISFVNM